MASAVGILTLLAVSALAAAPATAQEPKAPTGHVSSAPSGLVEPVIQVYAHTFRHQKAAAAISLVRMHLSPTGTVELQPASNSLVVRDRDVRVRHIRGLLRQFDRPPEQLRFEIQVLRADHGAKQPADSDALPAELVARLKDLLRYDSYDLLARTELSSLEGEDVTYALGGDYSVSFRSGTVLGGKRLRLEDFQILQRQPGGSANKSRQLEPRRLVQTHLNLWMNQLFVLAVAPEGGKPGDGALMVAITCRREEPSARE